MLVVQVRVGASVKNEKKIAEFLSFQKQTPEKKHSWRLIDLRRFFQRRDVTGARERFEHLNVNRAKHEEKSATNVL